MSQQDLDRSYARAPNNDSPEQHLVHTRSRSTAHAHSPKRLSVFSGRSRSNTTNSTTSSRRSPASSMTSVDAASLPSHDDRTGSAAGVRHERPESVTKSLLSRGSRILRRQGSKFHIVSTLDEEDEMEREKPRFEVSEIFSRNSKSRQSDAHDQLKSLISDPFDFHHLTHTSPSQFQSLERARETDLVTEFSAIRASQRPVTNLKGIQAEDLHFRGFSTEDLTQCGTAIGCDEVVAPPPTSPPASPSGSSTVSPKQLRAPRESRVENFSRPVPRFPKLGSTTPPPPPRASSPKLASSPDLPEPARAIDEILGLSTQPTYPEHVYSHTDDVEPGTSWPQSHIEDIFHPPSGHVFTTTISNEALDARASSMSLPTLSSDLEDVPEEDEPTSWHDDEVSPRAPARAFPSPLAVAQSPSIASMTGSRSDLSISVAEDLSRKFAEALGSPTLPQHRLATIAPPQAPTVQEPVRRRSSVNLKAIHETIYESWDADIDYCYEHAAESNCNFDWTRNSLDETRQEEAEVTVTGPDGSNALLGSMHLSASALSAVTNSRVVVTSTLDDDARIAVTQRDSDYFQPVRFAPALGKHINPDSLYEEYLTADTESERHFAFYSQPGVIQPMEQSVSPRSSFSPISKCNSQESLILSRAASVVRKHRSSVSTASVPDLVHSLASSREFQPSEQRLSGELSGMGRPESSHHRQTKSLARELEAQILFRADNDGSPEPAGYAATMAPSIHDRARSTTEMEAGPLIARAIKNDKVSRAAPRRKGRASYSLFPTTAAN
ncbi:hypothetical protein BO94DRAFT_90658 [Aspergillus sclerotioniger CBS 115572]|uniref:CRIB domain-containing protein n=1 Tax=Aspergillus sclerotioniger CBS 115572 TaxID=1450535 RepID=A0A317WI23_9EURO|nr:hypothetical protein BO94DRAFT_90658 [Aspergillus sclerotioniger CBS 115572]PWY85685.1 hypothetical protein BO94DRAFT_90658 [Aspergillus sclerotioniger CBS 115572]